MVVLLGVLLAWAFVVSFLVGLLWARVRHAEEDAQSGWSAVAESLDEIKGHLAQLYRRTDVLPDGGVITLHE